MSATGDIQKEVRGYIMVFVTLMVLTVVTVAVSYLKLSVVPAVILALLVATIKGSLVACYFMHLISERRLVYWVLGFTAFFFAALMCLTISGHYVVPEGLNYVS